MDNLLQTATQLGYTTLSAPPQERTESAVRLLLDVPDAAGLTASGGVLHAAVKALPTPKLQTALERHTGHALSLVVTTPEIFTQLKSQEQSLKFAHPENIIGALTNVLAKQGGSDLLLSLGARPSIKVQGNYELLSNYPPLPKGQLHTIIEWLAVTDTGVVTLKGQKWRVTITNKTTHPTIAMRALEPHPYRPEELNVPAQIIEATASPHGLILVTSPPAHGKTTTLASLTERIVLNDHKHIATVAHVPEFQHTSRTATVTPLTVTSPEQLADAIRTATTLGADVVTVELGDAASIKAALQATLAGHLVLATLPAPNITSAIQQLTSQFAPDEQPWALHALSTSLRAVLAQTLLPAESGGRTAVFEHLIVDNSVRELIRTNQSHHIASYLSDTSETNQSLEHSLASAVTAGIITEETALPAVTNTSEYVRHLPDVPPSTAAETPKRRRKK